MEEPYAEEPKLMFPICHFYINDKRGDIKMKYALKKIELRIVLPSYHGKTKDFKK